jgi:hypothetical protein
MRALSDVRQVWDKCLPAERIALQLADHRALGMKIIGCDLDEACRGCAAAEMDDLQAYNTMGAGKDRDIIKKVRIVLETTVALTIRGLSPPTTGSKAWSRKSKRLEISIRHGHSSTS